VWRFWLQQYGPSETFALLPAAAATAAAVAAKHATASWIISKFSQPVYRGPCATGVSVPL